MSWIFHAGAGAWQGEDGAAPVAFHEALPGYAPTPLVELPTVAGELGVGWLLVKDESVRLGLPAFKVLGVSWAVHRMLETSTPPALVTASAGNHGRALALVAGQHGLPARVYLPDGVHPAARTAIQVEGGTVIDVPGSYDTAVAAAAADAAAGGGALVQDTAWAGYEQIPSWIVEGYLTLFAEIDDQLTAPPDLVIIPVGAGSLAQAAVTLYRRAGLSAAPVLLTVEPHHAACLLERLAHDEPHTLATAPTIMTRLNCGTVSASAWPLLRAGLDAAREALTDRDRTDQLAVSDHSVVVLLCTEGRRRTPVERRTSMSEDVIDLLATLVSIDSVNPALIPGTAGETRIAEHVASWARENGLSSELVEHTPGRPSVIVRGGPGEGPTLLLREHLDTVGIDGVTDPFTPRVDGDRLYGRGAYDMKAGLAAALLACRDASRAGIAGEVVVAAVADEEHASLGVQETLGHIRADAAIVTEPTELRVATAHKGFVWTEIEVTGRSAHGSRPQLGVDAIMKTGPILQALEALDGELATRRTHPTLGPGTLHASLITGGREESTIPERCLLTVERRTLPGEGIADVESDITHLLQRCRDADPDLVVASRTTLTRNAFETNSDEPIVRAVQQALTRTDPTPVGVSYWADSAFIAVASIPTVLYGPAGDGAHAEIEWVSIPGTVECARTLTAVAAAFCA